MLFGVTPLQPFKKGAAETGSFRCAARWRGYRGYPGWSTVWRGFNRGRNAHVWLTPGRVAFWWKFRPGDPVA